MSNRAEQTRGFCERWLRKATLYDMSRVEDVFDKFFTLFVAFNRLYSHTAMLARQAGAGDRRMATRLFSEIIGHEHLWQAATSDGGTDIGTLRRLISPGGSFFLISGNDPDISDYSKNDDLYRRLGSSSACVAVDALLEYLYQVRCNMFHGGKEIDGHQLELMQPCVRCLDRIVAAGLAHLTYE